VATRLHEVLSGARNAALFLVQLSVKNRSFAKTGSGQTSGQVSYKRVLSAGAAAAAGGEASAGEPVSATAAAAAPAVDVSGRWEVSVAYTAGPP
jgi:hypothetical protein